MAEKEEKFLVINRKHLRDYFSQFTHGIFTTDEEKEHIDSIPFNQVIKEVEEMIGPHRYITCNQDEPYADLVWQVILLGEDGSTPTEIIKKLRSLL